MSLICLTSTEIHNSPQTSSLDGSGSAKGGSAESRLLCSHQHLATGIFLGCLSQDGPCRRNPTDVRCTSLRGCQSSGRVLCTRRDDGGCRTARPLESSLYSVSGVACAQNRGVPSVPSFTTSNFSHCQDRWTSTKSSFSAAAAPREAPVLGKRPRCQSHEPPAV